VIDQESDRTDDGAPVAPPIPSFASLRAPQRRSALDLLLPPAQAPADLEPEAVSGAEPGESAPAARVPEPTAPSAPAAPRPAEWGDLLRLGAQLGTCVTRVVADRLAGLRSLFRG
jgi:hypothetical protein